MTRTVWGRLAALLVVAAAGLGPSAAPVVAAAPARGDVRTEGGPTATKARSGADTRSTIPGSCTVTPEQLATGERASRVRCDGPDTATLYYVVRVPATAVVTSTSPRIDTVSQSSEATVTSGAFRGKPKRLALTVELGGAAGEWVVRDLSVTYRVPSRYDTRPCVTAGELARMDEAHGGFGGTLEEVAAVFDTNGRRTSYSEGEDSLVSQRRAYRLCDGGKIEVGYYNGASGVGTWTSAWPQD